MGFDAKSMSEPAGILRLTAIVCILIARFLPCFWRFGYGGSYDSGLSLFFFMVGEIVFLVLGCIGLMENDIVKLIDKIFQLIAAIITLLHVILWLVGMFDYGFGPLMCIIAWILDLVVGLTFAALAKLVWS